FMLSPLKLFLRGDVWFVEQRLDDRLESFARLRTIERLPNSALAIENMSNRQTGTIAKLISYFFGPAYDCVILLDVFLEGTNHVRRVQGRNGSTNNREASTTEISLQLVEFRHFRTAGNAPRRPKIKQHYSA